MPSTFYFYDLETSGTNPKTARIMQFAGQRTNMKLEPIGEPDDVLVKLNSDVLPEPEAVLIHGFTPQKVNQDGISEDEFSKWFYREVATPGTIFLGYNNVRFDDEFMRYLFFRNFQDPYAWTWKNECSRWDLLDVVRIMRALRPEGIKWPVDSEGTPTNRLEMLTTLNGIEHSNSHNALADVEAMIEFAKLMHKNSPKLFEYMLEMRDKKRVKELVNAGQPFVYVSGRYNSQHEKLTIVETIGELDDQSAAIEYDLRVDPAKWIDKTEVELKAALFERHDNYEDRLPCKLLKYNHCPAVAPVQVVDEGSKKRLSLEMNIIEANRQKLLDSQDFINQLVDIFKADRKRLQTELMPKETDSDERLYEGFVSDSDRQKCIEVSESSLEQIKNFKPDFNDIRLRNIFPLYKARNFPKTLSSDEQTAWQEHVSRKLFSGGQQSRLVKFFINLQTALNKPSITRDQQYLLEELRLYAESIAPTN